MDGQQAANGRRGHGRVTGDGSGRAQERLQRVGSLGCWQDLAGLAELKVVLVGTLLAGLGQELATEKGVGCRERLHEHGGAEELDLGKASVQQLPVVDLAGRHGHGGGSAH